MELNPAELEYVGFWARVWAAIIDTVLCMMILVPLILVVVGPEYFADERIIKGGFGFLVEWLLPAAAVLAFWIARGATPGKMAIAAYIVDAGTGERARANQLVGRYLGYYLSIFPLCLGLIWVAFDGRKQGWHDKLAGTVVVRPKKRGPQSVSFDRT